MISQGLIGRTQCARLFFWISHTRCALLLLAHLVAVADSLLVQVLGQQGPLVLLAALDKEQQVWLLLQPARARAGHLLLSSCCEETYVVMFIATGLLCRCHRAAGHPR